MGGPGLLYLDSWGEFIYQHICTAIREDCGVLLWVLPEIDLAIQEQVVHLGGDPTVGGWEGKERGRDGIYKNSLSNKSPCGHPENRPQSHPSRGSGKHGVYPPASSVPG